NVVICQDPYGKRYQPHNGSSCGFLYMQNGSRYGFHIVSSEKEFVTASSISR
ncbi:hypothetical protein MRX96_051779, partial [Rhipicephalus microplus]